MAPPVDEKAYPLHLHPDEGHEMRLQRLEAGQQQMTGQLAAATVKLEAIDDKVDSSTALITAHIDSAVKPLAQKLHDHIAADGVVAGRVDLVEQQAEESAAKLRAMEAKQAAKRERWDGIRKLFVPALAAAIGIGAKELIAFIVRHS